MEAFGIIIPIFLPLFAVLVGTWVWIKSEKDEVREWRALYLGVQALWLAAGVYIFTSAYANNPTMANFANSIWSLNLFSGGWPLFPGIINSSKSFGWLFSFIVWWIAPALFWLVTASVFSWIDRTSGLRIVERLVNLLGKKD